MCILFVIAKFKYILAYTLAKLYYQQAFLFPAGMIPTYTPYEGLYLTNQKSRKLRLFGRKLEGSHSPFYHYFDKYYRK